MCVCFYTWTACVVVGVCQWPGGMEGIPVSFLGRPEDFREGEWVPGRRGVTGRSNKFHTKSTFRVFNMCVCLLRLCFCGYVKPVFVVGNTQEARVTNTISVCFCAFECVACGRGGGMRMRPYTCSYTHKTQMNTNRCTNENNLAYEDEKPRVSCESMKERGTV